MEEAFYISSNNELNYLGTYSEYYISGHNVVTFDIPQYATTVGCAYNKLTRLVLPKGLRFINCCHNQLTELILPEGVETVHCEGNEIKNLILPESLLGICCDIGTLDMVEYKNSRINITLFIK